MDSEQEKVKLETPRICLGASKYCHWEQREHAVKDTSLERLLKGLQELSLADNQEDFMWEPEHGEDVSNH